MTSTYFEPFNAFLIVRHVSTYIIAIMMRMLLYQSEVVAE
jgi:hypothetical protein